MIKSIASMLPVLVALHFALNVAHAQSPDHTWHQFDGSWFEANKWDQGTVPGNSSIVEIQEHIVTIGSPGAEALELRMNPVYGFGSELDISGDHFGTLTTQSGYIGYSSSASGAAAVKLDEQGAVWNNTGDITVGYQKWNGTNTLDIRNGAAVSSARGILGDFPVASGPAVNGTVNVDGSLDYLGTIYPSKWNMSGERRVGNFGAGTLNVTNGGNVTNTVGYIGVWGGSSGTVNVSGYISSGHESRWTNSGDLVVGHQSTATNRLNIENGGTVSSARGIIGDYGPFVGFPSAVGEVNVTESSWNSGTELRVGNAGTGTLRLIGSVVSSNVGRVGFHPNSNGTVVLSSTATNWSRWFMTGDLTVGVGGQGALSVGTNSEVSALLGVTIGSNGSLAGTGKIIANNVANNGNVHPSQPLASLTVNGNYSQTSSGTLNIDLDGDGISKLAVNGSVAVAGTLNVTNLDFPSWEPEIGQSFDLLDWVGGASGISGSFSSISLPVVHSPKMWNKTRLYTTGVISVSHAGDFNDDSLVDAGDFIAWRTSGGSAAEYNMWRANFGFGGPGSGSAALASSMSRAVPEPSSSTLLIVATTLVACGRRSRRQHITGALPPGLRQRRGATLRRAAVGRAR